MTEAEATEALVDIAMACSTYFSIFVSLSFAYFTVAYLVGAVLTRFQLVLITLVYGLAQVLMGATFVIWVNAFQKLYHQEETVLSETWLLESFAWTEMAVMLLTLVLAASLYFMYDVRTRVKA